MSKTRVDKVNTLSKTDVNIVNTVCSRVYVKESRRRSVFPSCIHKVNSVSKT